MKPRAAEFFKELLENRTAPAKVALIVKGLFLFVAAICLLAIATGPELSDSEGIFYGSVKAFVERPDIKIDQLSAYKIKVYLFSFPYRLGASTGQGRQVLLMRGLGLIFLGLALWLGYQAAKRVAPNKNLIGLGTLAFLATNNRLLFSGVTVGGDAWLWFFFSFLMYELVEVAAKGALLDVLISLGLIFILSKFDPLLAEKVALPILFLVIVATLIAANAAQIAEGWRGLATGTRAAIGGGIIAAFILAQRVSLPALLLSAPMSLFVSLINFGAWPAVFKQLVAFFSDNPDLAAGFAWVKTGMSAILLLTSLAGAAGLVWLAYLGISERLRVIDAGTVSPSNDATTAGSRRITLIKPDKSIGADLNLPALIGIAFFPLTVFAAYNTYQLSFLLGEVGIYTLVLPLALLLSVGLQEIILAGKSTRAIALLPATLLTINAAALLLTVLWR